MKEKMRAVRKLKSEKGLTLAEAEVPSPRDNEVLVKVKACSLCGTDVHIYNWEHPWNTRVKPPRTLGHELCGIVEEVGRNVISIKRGDYVSAESHIACGTCFQCKIGNQHVCLDMKLLGVDVNGGFADYVSIPEVNAWKNPRDMPPEIATLEESLGNSVYTTYSGDIVGKTVTVFGLGPTGLFSVGLAKVAGATKIIAVGGTTLHLNIAKRMGADITINRHTQDVVKEIAEATDGIGADVFLEMSGSPQAIDQGLKTLRRGGRATLLGLPSQNISLDWSKDVVLKEVHINGIWGRKMFETWVTTSRLLSSGRLDIRPVITHRLKLEEYEKAVEAASSGQAGKAVMFT